MLLFRLLPSTNMEQPNSTEFRGTQGTAGTEKSNLHGNSVTISGHILFPPPAQPSGIPEFEKNPKKNILFSGNFLSNFSSDESLAEISVRNNKKITKYLCFKRVSTMRSTLIKKAQQWSIHCTCRFWHILTIDNTSPFFKKILVWQIIKIENQD